jgi:hypothetical protein
MPHKKSPMDKTMKSILTLLLAMSFTATASYGRTKKEALKEKAASTSRLTNWRESYFAGEPMRIGNRVQYLLDDYIVEDKYAHLTFRMFLLGAAGGPVRNGGLLFP